jgi:AcrR family transcriptional regulator
MRNPQSLQEKKSNSTRNLILDSAIECLFEEGYSDTSTALIAAKAGLSRGAMMHHYPTKIDLITALIEHLNEKRKFAYSQLVASIPDTKRLEQEAGIEAYWELLTSKESIALKELRNAARTDNQYSEILRQATREIENEWRDFVLTLFPEWKNKPDQFNLAMDLTQFLMEGMAMHHINGSKTFKKDPILNYLKLKLLELFKS